MVEWAISPTYQTVFDVSESVPWRALAFVSGGAFMVGVGYIMWMVANERAPKWLTGVIEQIPRRKPITKRALKAFAMLWVAFGFFWVATAGTGIVGGWLSYRAALESGEHEVVEGLVEDFAPMPYSGGKHESFTVSEVRFSYSDYNATPSFNRTRSHGGPIREGLPVRISYIAREPQNPILKLEIPVNEPATSDHDASIERPTFPFWLFTALMFAFALAIGWLLFINKTASLKRRFLPALVVLGTLVFVIYGLDTGVPPLFVGIIVPLMLINLWITRFCDACGATVVSQKLWKRPTQCTKCGAALGSR